jgi:hypothetical protein
MAKKSLQIRIDEEILNDIEKVANAAGMERNDYAALWLRKVSQLKLDYGLDALTSIPKDFFKSHGGRPSHTVHASGVQRLQR